MKRPEDDCRHDPDQKQHRGQCGDDRISCVPKKGGKHHICQGRHDPSDQYDARSPPIIIWMLGDDQELFPSMTHEEVVTDLLRDGKIQDVPELCSGEKIGKPTVIDERAQDQSNACRCRQAHRAVPPLARNSSTRSEDRINLIPVNSGNAYATSNRFRARHLVYTAAVISQIRRILPARLRHPAAPRECC